MKQEEELDLVLQVLLEQFRYDIKVHYIRHNTTEIPYSLGKDRITFATFNKTWTDSYDQVKPYLRSLPTMTEEEICEWNNLIDNCDDQLDNRLIDYCNRKHLDWRHLIEKGLADEAPNGMYE